MDFWTRWHDLLIGMAALALFLLVFMILALAMKSWPGNVNSCLKPAAAPVTKKGHPAPAPAALTGPPPAGAISDPNRLKDCYCEALRAGNIRQPICTFSALAFSLGGLLILWWLGMERSGNFTPPFQNTLVAMPGYQATYGYIIVAMGPGSMMFHATMTSWGGWIDQLSMLFFLCFVAAYNLSKGMERLGWISTSRQIWCGVIYSVLLVTFAVILAFATSAGTWIFVTAASVVGVSEWALWFWVYKRNPWWLMSCTITMALAVLWWVFSQGKGVECNPTSLFQWHGLWHATAASFVTMIYFYLKTEQIPDSSAG